MMPSDEIPHLLAQALRRLQEGKCSDAEACLENAHQRARDKPLYHAKIHAIWFYIKMRSHDVRGMLEQIFPIIFAIPVSLVIAIKNAFVGQSSR